MITDFTDWMALHIDISYLVGVLFILIGFFALSRDYTRLSETRVGKWLEVGEFVLPLEFRKKWKKQIGLLSLTIGIAIMIIAFFGLL